MNRTVSFMIAVVVLLSRNVSARTIEDVLREKGYITEEEYEEIKAKPGAPEKTAPFVFGYKPGKGFNISTPDGANALTLGGRVQVRYTGIDREDAEDESSFRVRRMRIWTEGHLYSPNFRYGFQGDFAGTFSLRDAYVEFGHVPQASLKVGQFKIPYNRQQITSSGALQFVDRPVTNEEFLFGDDGRDIGGMLHGDVWPERLAYAVGVFNGSGPNTTNENTGHMVVGRVLITPFGPFKDYYSEGDLVGSETPRFGIGAATAYTADETRGRITKRLGLADPKLFPSFTGADIFGATADAHFKCGGFGMFADYYYRHVDPHGSIDAIDAHGAVVQAGYFILPQKLEWAARYAWVDPNDSVGHDSVQEYGGAVGYFFSGHNLKVQADLRGIDRERPGKGTANDLEARVQVQAIF